ncbi:D-alanyl-lipoteichoic acid biosynthesis protein DltB [Clostridium sp. AF19-22AC]|jgi:membrane protein involved in D-alanine export|uniref:D-alanyl-lipoteichoic acid biosynthesis protein DltB n=1 Tax=Clostridia TaxID=186801 RepID=UPI000E4F867E|nr:MULTISPECIES: D-alanyl-lipoteichoic acid biosynthesis protein DltB [Clostridia]RHR27073.1 D-alanyl-lipoteichoic acid biosynthesis protein DltB [Clostridium sp. AF19-22AC]
MSFYDSLLFFMVLIIALIPAFIMGIVEKKKKLYIVFISVVMLVLVYKDTPSELLYLGAFTFLEWHIIAIYQWILRRYGAVKQMFHHAVFLALLPLVISKLSGLYGQHWFSFLGISYVTFKSLQIIIESYDGIIVRSQFIPTMGFLLFFPSISSGPIDRSRRFEEDLEYIKSRKEYLELAGKGIWKIMAGLLYKFVLSSVAFEILQMIDGRYKPQYLVAYAYVYGIYMFFDFAGYSLMAIGTSYILGICTPDNFNKPFISKDIKEFWDRWHITLSHWFRDFVFSRFMMSAIRGKWFKNRLNAAAGGFIVNMLLMGLWHGLTVDYILYGLYHGVLLAGTEVYQKKSKFYKQNKGKKWYKALSWFITLNLVMFGFLIFSGYLSQTYLAVAKSI